jgi:hypothetical protein
MDTTITEFFFSSAWQKSATLIGEGMAIGSMTRILRRG